MAVALVVGAALCMATLPAQADEAAPYSFREGKTKKLIKAFLQSAGQKLTQPAPKGTPGFDFCTEIDAIIANSFLPGLNPYLNSLLAQMGSSEIADVNGGFLAGGPDDPYKLNTTADGIPDFTSELQLLEAILNDPLFDNGVLNHATVLAAFNANKAQIQADIGNLDIFTVVPELPDVFAAYLTIGGGSYSVGTYPLEVIPDVFINYPTWQSTGSFGGVAAIVSVISYYVYVFNPALDEGDYQSFEALQPYGDADGDGAPNICEFNEYGPGTCNSGTSGTDYVGAALNAAITPADCSAFTGPAEGEGEGEGECEDAVIVEASFDAATPSWTTTGSALISTDVGNTHSGAGAAYLLFDTSDGPDSVSQDIVIPAGGLATLSFWRQTLRTDAALEVRIDGILVYDDPGTVTASYHKELVYISGFADGGTHTVTFTATATPLKASYLLDGINIDDVAIEVCPAACEECTPTNNNFYQVGESACLRVPDPVDGSSTFEWDLDGVPLIESNVYQGVACRSLFIPSLDLDNAGTYTCTYDDGSKSVVTYTVNLEVAESVPLLGLPGLLVMLLSIVASASGAQTLRRRTSPRQR